MQAGLITNALRGVRAVLHSLRGSLRAAPGYRAQESLCAKEGIEELLLDYCAGTLEPAAAAEFSKHAADCAGCRRVIEAQREVWNLLDRWTPAEVPPDFDRRLYARIAREETAPLWVQWWRRFSRPAVPYTYWKPALTVAAACAVLALGLWVRTAGVPDSSPQIRAENVDIEQVENTLEDLDMLMPFTQASTSPL